MEFDNELLINIGLALLAVLGFVILVYGINRFFKYLNGKINDAIGTKIKGFKFKTYQILTAAYMAQLIIGFLKVFRLLIILICFYFWLPLLFSIFPWTKNIAHSILDYTLSPLKELGISFISYLPSLFFILVVFVIVRYINRLLKFFADEISRERLKIDGFYKEWSKPTYNIIRFIILIFAIVIIFPYLPGSNSPAFQGLSIFMGVLLSLGSTGFVANAVGGLMIIYMRPFIIGDVVQIGENLGRVVSKSILVTRLITPKNEEISVPNKTVSESQIINYSSKEKGKGVFIHTTITIGYDVPWRKVHEMLTEAANRTSNILSDPKPFVLQTALNDFNVAYELNGYTKEPLKMAKTFSELNQHIQDVFREENIEILSPYYKVERRNEESTVPKE